MFMKHLRRFATDRRANILPMFGLAFIPVVGLIGAAVDYSRANAVKTKLQAALDSTALAMSAKAASQSSAELQTSALSYFNALFQSTDATSVTFSATYAMTSTGPQVTVTGATSVPTKFMNIPGFGISNIPVNGSSTSAWGNTRLRVALALDNTGSMADDGKMTALKTATKSLLSQLKASANNNGDVYVSIIPFSRDVNVGASNYTASWIDWTDWDAQNKTGCSGWGWGNGGCGGWGWGNGGGTPANHNTWNGCITDRDQDYDVKNTTPTGTSTTSPTTLFPAEQYDYCPVAMMAQNYNWTAMNNLVDSMKPAGNTNQAIGLAWAWQSLTPNAPLNAPPKDSNFTYTDVIILLSDGLNTENRWTNNQSAIDARQTTLCNNIKAAGITLYVIQVNTGGDPMSTMMKNCASSPDKYWMLTNSNQIVSLFNQLATKLSRLRVAK
jgi:Flp pilus assembly protein TadG